jgi:hypothetical protein
MRKNIHKTIKQKKEKAWRFMLSFTFRVGLIVFVCVIGVFYVGHMSSASTKGYTLSKLQIEIKELEHKNQRLSYEISQYRSMVSIEERLDTMDFIAMGTPNFADVNIGHVALRD